MSVFLKIDIPRGQESNYFNRPKYLVYEDRSLYETDFEGNRWLFAYHCHPGYSFLELPVNIKDIEMHVDIKSASTRDEMNVKVSGDFLYVLIFSLVADKFIPVFCREIIFMVFDESFQVGLTGDLRRTVCPFMSDH